MQGYFKFDFFGTKDETDKLVHYLEERKETDSLHSFLYSCLGKSSDYDKCGMADDVSISVDMSNVGGSGNVRGLDIESIVAELCEAVPALSMDGYFHLLDAPSKQKFVSEAGSSDYQEEWTSVCTCCGKEFSEDEEIYYSEDDEAMCEDCYREQMIEMISDETGEEYEDLAQLSTVELEEKASELEEE